jgi:hypothetical protein
LTRIYTTPIDPHIDDKILPVVRFKSVPLTSLPPPDIVVMALADELRLIATLSPPPRIMSESLQEDDEDFDCSKFREKASDDEVANDGT